jgi:L-malate glycosyltransferase
MNIFVVHASHRLTDRAAHGDGLIAWGFAKALAARGHKLWIAAPRIDVGASDVEGIELFELRPRSRNKALQLAEYAVRSRLLYERLSRRIRFDIVHQMNPVVRGYSFGMAGVRAPLVLGPYNGDWPLKPFVGKGVAGRAKHAATRMLRYAADVLMLRQARALVITTPYALNRLPGLAGSSARLHVVPNGIDDAVFAPSAIGSKIVRPALQSILMVGNATQKGIFTMLAAFERIAATVPNAELVIAGGGAQLVDVQARVDASTYRERYRLIGNVDRERMPGVVRDASVVCVPSFGEPFGMIVLEGMASGKPVVGTNAGGIPYILGTESPMLFTPGDDAALAAILERLLHNPDLLEQIGTANRNRVTEEFTWDSVARKLEVAYASAAK